MGLLSEYASGLALNIFYDFIKSNFAPDLKKEIDCSYNDAIKEWSIELSIHQEKSDYLKKYIEEKHLSGQIDTSKYSEDVKAFLKIFNIKLCSYPQAYRYFNDIKTQKQYCEFKESLKIIDSNIESLQLNGKAILEALQNHTPILKECEKQLEAYYELLEDLKPKTAIQLIDALEKRIKENNLDTIQDIQARIHFLKGTCLEMMKGKINNSYLEFIKAYEMNPDVFAYREKACFCYYRIGENSKSSELVDSILNTNSFNATATATKLLLHQSEFETKINEVSLIVKKDFDFKRILYISINKRENKESLIKLFPEMILDGQSLELFETNYQNLKRNSFIVDLAINRFLRKFKIEWVRSNESDNEILQITKDVLEPFVNQIKGKELGGYFEVIFFNTYVYYLVEQKENLLHLLISNYQEIPSPKNELFSLILANCLQQKDRDADAIKILDEITSISQNSLSLKLYCANKIGDEEILLETVNQKIALYESIGINVLEDTLRCLRLLNEFEVLNRFQPEIIKKKSDQSREIFEFVELYYKIALHPLKKESPIEITKFKKTLALENNRINSFFIEMYFKTENFLECIGAFEEMKPEINSPYDINYYIFALYKDGTQNRKLLKWLKYWRKEVGYDARFVRIEIEKRAIINDWKECLEICSFGLENELHEDFLYHYAISAYHLADKESFDKIVKQAIEHTYEKQQRAIQLVNLLFHFEYFVDGLELCYRLAKEKDNKEARTLFFSSFIKTSEKYFVDYALAEIGHHVLYTLNNEEEQHHKIISDDSFSQKFIGLKVGDKINLNRQFGTQTDELTVHRICNKYLALKLEIMEETRNPHSGLGLQSINLNDFDSPLDAILSIVPTQDEDKDPFEEYYSEKIKFSQLPYFAVELNQNIIATYYKLVYEKRGILKVDPRIFPMFSFTDNYSFILDFSSLIHFYELSKNDEIDFLVKFKISSFMMVLIKSYEEDNLGYRKQKKYRLDSKFYTDLKIWISKYCDIINPVSLLDMTAEKGNRNEPLFLYLMNQAAMMNEFSNSVLITDDLTYYQIYPLEQKKLMSTDVFLIYHLLISELNFIQE